MAETILEEAIKIRSKNYDAKYTAKSGKVMPKLEIISDDGKKYTRIGGDIPGVNDGDDVVMRYSEKTSPDGNYKFLTIVEVVKDGVAIGKAAPRTFGGFGGGSNNGKHILVLAATMISIHNKKHPDKAITSIDDLKAIVSDLEKLVA